MRLLNKWINNKNKWINLTYKTLEQLFYVKWYIKLWHFNKAYKISNILRTYIGEKVMLNVLSKTGWGKYPIDHCNNLTNLLNLTAIEFHKFYCSDQNLWSLVYVK